jgi:hypothetical protein
LLARNSVFDALLSEMQRSGTHGQKLTNEEGCN